MEKYVWIVYEDNHGAVSYFDSAEKAIEEMKKIANNMYEDSITVINQYEDYIDVIFENDYCMIHADRIELNKSWVD